MRIDLADLPMPAVIALAALAAVQTALMITALIVLVRTDRVRLLFEKRWPWVLIILLLNLVGPIVFLAAGRRPPAVDLDGTAQRPAVGVTSVVDGLYGDDREERG